VRHSLYVTLHAFDLDVVAERSVSLDTRHDEDKKVARKESGNEVGEVAQRVRARCLHKHGHKIKQSANGNDVDCVLPAPAHSLATSSRVFP
jgi:hypothetical protein